MITNLVQNRPDLAAFRTKPAIIPVGVRRGARRATRG